MGALTRSRSSFSAAAARLSFAAADLISWRLSASRNAANSQRRNCVACNKSKKAVVNASIRIWAANSGIPMMSANSSTRRF